MSQKTFPFRQIIAACILFTTVSIAQAGFLDDLGATLRGDAKKESAMPEPESAKASGNATSSNEPVKLEAAKMPDNAVVSHEPAKPAAAKVQVNAASSGQTPIQKLQADFDALAKKENPEKGDWKGLYDACSGLFEIRDFSRIFGCVGIAEKWQAKVGEEPRGKGIGIFSPKAPHVNYPTAANVTLIEAKAFFDTGNYLKTIELTKRSLAEYERVRNSKMAELAMRFAERKQTFLGGVPVCNFDDVEPCLLMENSWDFYTEGNLLLATALFIEGKKDESAKYSQIVERLINLPNVAFATLYRPET